MKKTLLLTITLSSAVLFSQAQINKGTVLLGGGFNVQTAENKYDNATTSETKSTSLQIGPSIGIAVKDNSVIGVNLQYGHTFNSNTTTTTTSDKNYSYLTGIYFRRYMTLGKGFYLFGEADADYYTSKKSVIYPDNTLVDLTKQGSISLYPGIAYTVSKRMHLEISMNNLFNIGFTHIKYVRNIGGLDDSYNMKYFGASTNFNAGSALAVGFRFTIGK